MTDSDKPRRSVTRMPPAAIRLEFGRTIQRHLNERGWTQAELARRMKPFLKDSRIGRDSISKYVRGKNLPNPPVLEAMAKAFGVESRELLPSRGTQAVSKEHAPLDVRDMGEGRAWLSVNQALDWPTALKVIGLLRGTSDPSKPEQRPRRQGFRYPHQVPLAPLSGGAFL
jgi:transcriptional regulator with XRE-family HTH domain